MMKFLLSIPDEELEQFADPRRTVTVSLPAKQLDEMAELQFEGDVYPVHMVTMNLLSAPLGFRGASIRRTTTPRHLDHAMHTPLMKLFDPQRLEGGLLIFSPEELLPKELDRIAREVVEVFTNSLPRLMDWDIMARGRLIENFRMITALSKEAAHVQSRCPAGTSVDLRERLADALTKANRNVEQVQQLLADGSAFLSDTDFADLQTDGARVALMLGPLANLFTETGDVDLVKLHADLKPNCP